LPRKFPLWTSIHGAFAPELATDDSVISCGGV
jgi:hypothetical protein